MYCCDPLGPRASGLSAGLQCVPCLSGLALTNQSPAGFLGWEANISGEVYARGRDLSDVVARERSRGDLEPLSPPRRDALEELSQSSTQLRLQLQGQMS